MSDKERATTIKDEQESDEDQNKEVQPATQGVGALLQRDYWCIIEGTSLAPQDLIRTVLERFPEFSPEGWACFYLPDGIEGPLSMESILKINIIAAGKCEVKVVHIDEQSFTMRTLDGHPEAGRITMGAYWDRAGRLKFRIRSRARTIDPLRYVGFQLFGKGIQSRIWIEFIKRMAEALEGRIHGEIHEETQETSDSLADMGELDTPTFIASKEQ